MTFAKLYQNNRLYIWKLLLQLNVQKDRLWSTSFTIVDAVVGAFVSQQRRFSMKQSLMLLLLSFVAFWQDQVRGKGTRETLCSTTTKKIVTCFFMMFSRETSSHRLFPFFEKKFINTSTFNLKCFIQSHAIVPSQFIDLAQIYIFEILIHFLAIIRHLITQNRFANQVIICKIGTLKQFIDLP